MSLGFWGAVDALCTDDDGNLVFEHAGDELYPWLLSISQNTIN